MKAISRDRLRSYEYIPELMSELRGIHYGVVHLQVQAVPVVTLLSYLIGRDIAAAPDLISLGAVYVNDHRVMTETFEIKNGDYVRVHTKPRRFTKPSGLKNRVLEKTSDFLILDKPAGIPVHSQVDNCRENLICFLEQELGEELFITHRLDTETSGCLLIARTLNARRKINELFRERLIKKNYVAVAERPVEPGHYIHFMEPSFKSPKVLSETEKEGWARCELKVLTCNQLSSPEMPGPGGLYELEIELITGRPQQIRAQLSYLNAPIIGDIRYGSSVESAEPNSIGLRCSELNFDRTALGIRYSRKQNESVRS